jgi:hypothetical protein
MMLCYLVWPYDVWIARWLGSQRAVADIPEVVGQERWPSADGVGLG